MDADLKTIFGGIAAVVAVLNYLPYLIGGIRKTLRPHAFSWIIFTIITATIATAQLSEGAGAGAWATGATSVITCLIGIFALKNGGYRITRWDTVSFVGALAAMPAWILTANPLAAVIILTIIETLGFMPTYRKAYRKPQEESVLAFSLTILKYALALMAMQTYSLATLLFPIAVVLLSVILIVEILWRRTRTSKRTPTMHTHTA